MQFDRSLPRSTPAILGWKKADRATLTPDPAASQIVVGAVIVDSLASRGVFREESTRPAALKERWEFPGAARSSQESRPKLALVREVPEEQDVTLLPSEELTGQHRQ